MLKPFGKFSPLLVDYFALFLLLLLTIGFASRSINFAIAPFEDAAILMRYAQHFADGYGIVWNIGEKPVDGATDFLFLVILGLVVRLGAPLELATRGIGFIAHVLTVWIVYWSARRIFNAHIIPSFVAAVFLTVGPGLNYVAAYFGTPFFALFACITWYTALVLTRFGETRRYALYFAASALITSLIRPEGVILTGLMLLTVVLINGLQGSKKTIACYLAIFAVIGGLYFVWRWQYFGYPLPNPFYKKGGGSLYPDSLRASIINTITLSLPFLLAYVWAFYAAKNLRKVLGFLLPVVGFASAFILLSDEMNFGGRFQYVLLPIILMSWAPLTEGVEIYLRFPRWGDLKTDRRIVYVVLILILSVGIVGYQYWVGRAKYFRDGRYDVAKLLTKYGELGLGIATTEAGLLPLYSKWRALDTWGLNDQQIAHSGGISAAHLAKFDPTIIVFHAQFSPVSPKGPVEGEWQAMVSTLQRYAEDNEYALAAAFGVSPYDTHYYFVKSNSPVGVEIIRQIQSTDYYWYETGKKTINYAQLAPTQP